MEEKRILNQGSVVYIGAGGGGDTNSAIIQALSEKTEFDKINSDAPLDKNLGSPKQYVLGAGYSRQEYTDSLINGMKNKDGTFDRYSASDEDLVNEYLNKTIVPIDGITDVWNLKDDETARANLFNTLKPKHNIPYDSPDNLTVRGYKYRALLEEGLLLKTLKSSTFEKADVLKNVHMFYSTDKYDKRDLLQKSFNALYEFIKNKNISKIVLMDFGADLVYFAKNGRDPIVLLNILRIMQLLPRLTLEIKIYGVGVDSHLLPEDVIINLTNFGTKLGVPIESAEMDQIHVKQLTDFIRDNENLLSTIDILGSNRATGNWYEAYKMCNPSATGGRKRRPRAKKGGDISADAKTYIEERLLKRSEIKLEQRDAKRPVYEKVFEDPNIWCTLAKAYVFRITSAEAQGKTSLLNELSTNASKFNELKAPVSGGARKHKKHSTGRKTLDNCTVAELKERAAKRGVKVTGLKKAEILAKLRK